MKRKHLAAVVAVTASTLALGQGVASAATVFDGYYGCSGSYPRHANTIWGSGDHAHYISTLNYILPPVGGANFKSVWPTTSSYNVYGSSVHHVGVVGTAGGGTSSVYCRTP